MKTRLMWPVYVGFALVFTASRIDIVDLDVFGLSVEILAVLLMLVVLGIRLLFR